MEYEDGVIEPIFGAFYASASYTNLKFNYFREDEDYPVKEKLKAIDVAEELAVLRDNNLTVIKNNPEFITNKMDDNLTVPLFTGFVGHVLVIVMGLNLPPIDFTFLGFF